MRRTRLFASLVVVLNLSVPAVFAQETKELNELNSKAIVSLKEHNYSEAESLLNKALEQAKDKEFITTLKTNLAVVYRKQGKDAEAIALEKELAPSPAVNSTTATTTSGTTSALKGKVSAGGKSNFHPFTTFNPYTLGQILPSIKMHVLEMVSQQFPQRAYFVQAQTDCVGYMDDLGNRYLDFPFKVMDRFGRGGQFLKYRATLAPCPGGFSLSSIAMSQETSMMAPSAGFASSGSSRHSLFRQPAQITINGNRIDPAKDAADAESKRVSDLYSQNDATNKAHVDELQKRNSEAPPSSRYSQFGSNTPQSPTKSDFTKFGGGNTMYTNNK